MHQDAAVGMSGQVMCSLRCGIPERCDHNKIDVLEHLALPPLTLVDRIVLYEGDAFLWLELIAPVDVVKAAASLLALLPDEAILVTARHPSLLPGEDAELEVTRNMRDADEVIGTFPIDLGEKGDWCLEFQDAPRLFEVYRRREQLGNTQGVIFPGGFLQLVFPPILRRLAPFYSSRGDLYGSFNTERVLAMGCALFLAG